jgi:hypothetical protein
MKSASFSSPSAALAAAISCDEKDTISVHKNRLVTWLWGPSALQLFYGGCAQINCNVSLGDGRGAIPRCSEPPTVSHLRIATAVIIAAPLIMPRASRDCMFAAGCLGRTVQDGLLSQPRFSVMRIFDIRTAILKRF